MAYLAYGFFIALTIILAAIGAWKSAGICVVILLLAKYNQRRDPDDDSGISFDFGDGDGGGDGGD